MTKTPATRGRTATLLFSAAAVVSLIGLVDATYLTVEHLTGGTVRCGESLGCSEVLGSAYATIGGRFPVAALGALAYFMVFSLATLAVFGYTRVQVFLTFIVAAMFATTLWLFFVQAFILHAFCRYCLLSAAVTLALTAIVIGLRFVRTDAG